jgi:acetyl/propionyl-CoA carboxylase alpha subunit
MLKASAGGGGKGMRIVSSEDELQENLARAQSESKKAFGSDEIYIEKYIPDPKHIEVQVIADKHGNYRHLFERECSIQRRHQKIVEEAPSPSINSKVRAEVTSTAVSVAKAADYYNAGTIEFLLDQDRHFYFLEMNTRVQVEHPITEAITGVDIVKEQIKIAYGNKISFDQDDVKINGHAIECRICAEDMNNDFMPSTGKILHHRLPSGPGIRVDRGIGILSEITVHYDSLMAKLISWGNDRNESIARLKRALAEYQISGVVSNIPLFSKILNHDKFTDCSYTINTLVNDIVRSDVSTKANLEEIAALVSTLLNDKESNLTANKNKIDLNNKWTIDYE